MNLVRHADVCEPASRGLTSIAGLLLVGLLAGCRPPPAYGSDIASARWNRNGPWGLGVGTGWEYVVRSRPREGKTPIAYFYFVDDRCRLRPGEIHFQPWRKRELPADFHPEIVVRIEQRRAGKFEPAVDGYPPVQVPERGAAVELPVGTWDIEAWPALVDQGWAKYADIRVFPTLTVDPEYDALILMHHAVPPKARSAFTDAYERRLERRLERYGWRCYAGENLTPRFDARLEDAERH
jgi:hypothetical protein